MFGFLPYLPFPHLVGTVFNCAYAVRLETAPTGPVENTVGNRTYRGDSPIDLQRKKKPLNAQ